MSSSAPYTIDLSQTESNQLTAIADTERKKLITRLKQNKMNQNEI